MSAEPIKVLFVCLGNICRSPMAHAVMEHKKSQLQTDIISHVDSCGVFGEPNGTPTHKMTVLELKNQLGINFSKGSRWIDKTDFNNFDLILAMDEDIYEYLINAGKQHKDKIFMFRDFDPLGKGDVINPWGYEQNVYTEVFHIIDRTCDNIIKIQHEKRTK
ncbi:Low_molecular weight protein-tyrosine-phosphatase [Hexamita inflata]|uniref:Low molecular weight protein-tyrosine-phosphatase n=1 Tax=Hexamita inflata TaxID=28002 RepID=A0AA86N3T9_9EUKA|nr:Low molecular weight protein-tyrosine-phosphatase [Hexamita inflata]